MMSPHVNGYEMITQIRDLPQFADFPIIAMSAKPKKGDRQKYLEMGADDYLSKPVNTDKLFSLLQVWLC